MKEKIVRIVSILTSIVLFISILCTPAYAISTPCVQHHFSMLTFNADGDISGDIDDEIRTPPSENTCPYVAMSLLLTFYDSYWNDCFVDEDYEWNEGKYISETDTMSDTFAATSEGNDWFEYIVDLDLPENTPTYPRYPAYAMNHVNDYLEPYLISIGRLLGYHKANDEKLGLDDDETVAVLEYYLFNVQQFTRNDIEVHYLHEDDGDIEDVMRTQINNGFPVIYIGKKVVESESSKNETDESEETKKSGHELIAYGIDSNGNILLHTGWKKDSFRVSSSVEYNLNRAIIWLELKGDLLTHTHTEESGNYIDLITGNTLCACQIYSNHPAHENNHIYVDDYDSENHFESCHCGDAVRNVTPHNLTYFYYSSSKHRESCSDCYYMQVIDHSYSNVSSSSVTANGHQRVCNCGAISPSYYEHSIHSYGRCDKTVHYIYCECGYQIGTRFHVVPAGNAMIKFCIDCGQRLDMSSDIVPMPTINSTGGITYITDAGSYVDADGVIYLVDSDMELYLAGQLDVYALAENAKGYPSI